MHCLKNERLKSVILREALPMHLPAMFLIVAKRHGVQAWDAFLDKFGIPAAFFETPPGATEEEAMEFDATVQKLIGEGSGTIPNGAKLHTFETARDNTQTFEARARWCDDALLQLILGGKLTMTTEAGSGTLAGNAHQESFERLCAASARSISECINRQFCRRILREAFPDQPQLALFDLSAQKQEDLSEQAQLIATLSGAGFRPSPETVSEMMGFKVEAVEPTQPATPFSPGLQPITNRETDTPSTPDASSPLTEQELAALQSLSKGFAADQLEADADTIYNALADAISPSEDETDEEEETVENAKRHSDGTICRAFKGPCTKKGSRASKGNPRSKTTRSNTPLKATPAAKPQAKVNAIDHALKSTQKGGKVEGVAKIGKKNLDIEAGHPDYHGTRHAARHFNPGDTDAHKTAKSIAVGEKEKARKEEKDEEKFVTRHKGTISVLAEKKNKHRLITSYDKESPERN